MATRNVSLDLLRIISMFMILILHSVVFMKHPENLSVGSCLFLDFETVVCHSGVNLFVLITGFFLSGTSVRWDKIRNLIITVIFFNFLMLIPKFALLGGNLKDIILCLSPFKYWFINNYMALVMLAPFILQGISGMTDGMLKKLVVTTTLLNVVFGKYLGVSDGFSLIWFINLFLLGHYFRKTPFRLSSSMLLLAIVVLSILYTVGSFLMVNHWSISSVGKVGTVGVYSNAFCLAISLCIFALFRQRTLSACPASVQWFAESAFAVYLLTECFLVKESIWKLWNWLVLNHAESLLQMIGLQILFCSSLFILCVIIDKFRRLCFRFLRLERA